MPKLTPMLKQYLRIKAEHRDVILLFQLGDFYETFFEDAHLAARELQLTLTQREEAPMAGVPLKRAAFYVNQLLKKGYKVALCDQVEDARQARGLVERDVVRIITPGTVLEEEMLERGASNYIATLWEDGQRIALAYADLSTGEFRTTLLEAVHVRDEFARLSPSELLLPAPASQSLRTITEASSWPMARTELPASHFKDETMREHFGLHALEGLGLSAGEGRAAGGLLHYLKTTQMEALSHLQRPRPYSLSSQMALDTFTRRNLELFAEIRAENSRATLFSVLNRSTTAMGERLLRKWLLAPELDVTLIDRRLDVVEFFVQRSDQRSDLRDGLQAVGDLERLSGRLGARRATPRDLVALQRSLAGVAEIRGMLRTCAQNGVCADLLQQHAQALAQLALDDLHDLLARALIEDAPLDATAGGIIREGFSAELDHLRAEQRRLQQQILQLEAQERERTKIPSLKIGYNNVFGYYIEVTKAQSKRVPSDYHRKQTLAGAERYTVPLLKEYESALTAAEAQATQKEHESFCALRDQAGARVRELQRCAEMLAQLDVWTALAEVALRNRYCRPRLTAGREWLIKDGRHPIVELRLPPGEFVPNDLHLKDEDFLIILTGPNMSGKSVFLRQIALISVMAQIGSFVPAAEARLPVVDKLFSRVGASDMLAAGLSTFMVEMLETASILNQATARSLIILDEMGRGTSTFDGVSIAWAVAEHLATRLQAKALFATHYHELTKLADRLAGVKNLHVEVKEHGHEVVFLHKVAPGSAEGSYGVHVARMAGLPQEVTDKAEKILHQILVNNPLDAMGELRARSPRFVKQMALLRGEEHPILEELKRLDLEALTPLEALATLVKWKGLL